MTPTGIELACLKSPELCSAPGQEDALSMPQRLLETASTTAQIAGSELKGARNNEQGHRFNILQSPQHQGREPTCRVAQQRRPGKL